LRISLADIADTSLGAGPSDPFLGTNKVMMMFTQKYRNKGNTILHECRNKDEPEKALFIVKVGDSDMTEQPVPGTGVGEESFRLDNLSISLVISDRDCFRGSDLIDSPPSVYLYMHIFIYVYIYIERDCFRDSNVTDSPPSARKDKRKGIRFRGKIVRVRG
jgi:hypothetical protein